MKVMTLLGTREIKDTDVAWLAGIIDGEGNIGFETRSKVGSNITCRLVVTNTDVAIINNVKRIYSEIGIINYCNKRKRNQRKDGYVRRVCYDLQVHRLRELKVILEIIIPYLVGQKKDRAELALSYCNIRISKRSRVSCNKHAKYGEEELQIVNQLKILNERNNR
jgi:hypothetical protein